MSTPHIPQEILDKLVDYLSLERDSLKSLALTSPRFLHRSQSYLYRTLLIHVKVTQGMRNILDHNPSLLKLVRELHLTFDFTIPPAHALGRAENQMALSRLVSNLQGLDSLHLLSLLPTEWHELSPISQCLISDLFGHPLRTLSLYGLHMVPPQLLWPVLINTVESCGLRFATLAPLDLRETAPLRVKALHCAGPAIASVTRLLSPGSGFTLENLTHLDIAVTNDTHTVRERTAALELISQTSHRFKSLALEYPYHLLSEFSAGHLVGEDLSLPSMPGLRYLILHVKSCRSVPRESYALDPSVALLLHAILSGHPQPALEILELRVSWRAYSVPSTHFDSVSEPPIRLLTKIPYLWSAVNDVLADPTVFPILRGVRVSPDIQYPPYILNAIQPDSQELKAFIHIVPSLFHTEIMAALGAARKRLPVFDAGGDSQVGKAFDELKESVLARAGIDGDES